MALLETTVKNGKVQGIVSGNPEVSAFLGIPYAKAPAGKLRFRAPEPAEPWEGTRICNDFGYSCWQRDSGKNEAFRELVKNRPVPFRFLSASHVPAMSSSTRRSNRMNFSAK